MWTTDGERILRIRAMGVDASFSINDQNTGHDVSVGIYRVRRMVCLDLLVVYWFGLVGDYDLRLDAVSASEHWTWVDRVDEHWSASASTSIHKFGMRVHTALPCTYSARFQVSRNPIIRIPTAHFCLYAACAADKGQPYAEHIPFQSFMSH